MSRGARARRKKRQFAGLLSHDGNGDEASRKPTVYVVDSSRDHAAVENELSIQQIADDSGWKIVRVPYVELTMKGGESSGRRFHVLRQLDAHKLYQSMHRSAVAVLFSVGLHICLRPNDRVNTKHLIHISRFCMYKALTIRLDSRGSSDWPRAFSEWMDVTCCDGIDDPRILPHHMYRPNKTKGTIDILDHETAPLDQAEERHQFRARHHRDSAWRDDKNRRWAAAKPNAQHGREPQFVRNRELPLGFHWDVRASNPSTIVTPISVWKVQRGGHVNVYPDGNVRQGTNCREVWNVKQA